MIIKGVIIYNLKSLKQEQAEADGDGVRVFQEVVRVTDGAEPEAAAGGGGAEGHEGRPSHRHLPSQFAASPGLHPHHVPPLRACVLHCTQHWRRSHRCHRSPAAVVYTALSSPAEAAIRGLLVKTLDLFCFFFQRGMRSGSKCSYRTVHSVA